jgi:hypothetical protein
MPTRSLFAVDPAFKTGRTFQNDVQIDRALGDEYSIRVGFVYVKGDNLPVITDINVINPIGTLADGRDLLRSVSAAAPAPASTTSTRSVDRRFDIPGAHSADEALRARRQFDLTYALGRAGTNA